MYENSAAGNSRFLDARLIGRVVRAVEVILFFRALLFLILRRELSKTYQLYMPRPFASNVCKDNQNTFSLHSI